MRPFRDDDADGLADFLREREFDIPGGLPGERPAPDGASLLRAMRDQRTLRGTLALAGGGIVGYHEIRALGDRTLLGCNFYLAPEYRRRGFGARLAFVVLQYLAALPRGAYRRMTIFVSPANRVARQLYLRLGFVDSSVGEMQQLTPLLMSVPAFSRFAERHDLFASYETFGGAFSIDVRGVLSRRHAPEDRAFADRYEWQGNTVYPQRFSSGDDFVEILVDAESLEVCHVACPEFAASLMPSSPGPEAGAAGGLSLRISNASPRSLLVQGLLEEEPTALGPAETLVLEGAVRATGAAGRRVCWPCRVDGMATELGTHVGPAPGLEPMAPRHRAGVAAEVVGGELAQAVLEQGAARAVLDLALGGSVRSLAISGHEALRVAEDGPASLGWISPWKGGLFTLLEDEEWAFRLEPWGPFPGYAGFNTTLTRCTAGRRRAWREASRGRLVEADAFLLEPDGLRVKTRIENRAERPTAGAFALFAFLGGPPGGRGTRICSAEGVSRAASRRAFEVESRAWVRISSGQWRFGLSVTGGPGTVTAFNLGDDGTHLMLVCPFRLDAGDRLALSSRLTFEEVSAGQIARGAGPRGWRPANGQRSDGATTELARRLLALLEQEASPTSSAEDAAVRSFALLDERAAHLAGHEKARVWAALAEAIHFRFAGWRACGPYEISNGAVAFWGGTPREYVVVFRADGQVLFGKSHGQPGPSWRPDYESMESLAEYLERHARP